MKALLFDLDGTLADTLDDLADSMNWCLRRLGFPEHARDAYRYFVGDGISMLCRRALPENAQEAVPVLEEMMRRRYAENMLIKTRPYPGISELLEALSARGLALCVFSNKPHDSTVRLVAALFPLARFACARGQLPGVPRKPHPAGALAIAQEVGIPPREFLYVGDTATDMLTARAAGMTPVGALWGFRDRRELQEAGAVHIVSQPAEILSLPELAGPAGGSDAKRPPEQI